MSHLEAVLWAAEGVLVMEIAVPNPPPRVYRVPVHRPFRVHWMPETPETLCESHIITLDFVLTHWPKSGGERCHYLLDPKSVPKGWRVDVDSEGHLLADKV